MTKYKYSTEDICSAIENEIDTWDTLSLRQFVYEHLYDHYMDRSNPVEYIDMLMEKHGPEGWLGRMDVQEHE